MFLDPERWGPDLEPACREAEHPDEHSTKATGKRSPYVPLPGHHGAKLALEPPLELLQVAKGQGLHLDAGDVVIPPRLGGSEWDVQGLLEEGPGPLEIADLDLGAPPFR